MDTAGESPAKRVRKTHRGRRSAAAQKKRDQRNKKYFPGSFAFVWLAQNYGTANCNVASTSDGSDRSIETERGVVETNETTAGTHRTAGEMLEEPMNRTEATVRDTSQGCGNGTARAQEAPGADDGRFGFGAFAARYQPENFMVKTLDGVAGLGCFVPGQDGFNEDEFKKSSDQWRHDLEMRLL